MAKKRSADLLREAQQKAEDPQASATGAIKNNPESPEASGATSSEPKGAKQPAPQQPALEKATAVKSAEQATTVEPGSAIHLKGARVQRTAQQPTVEQETAVKVTAEVLTASSDQIEPLKILRNAEVIDGVTDGQTPGKGEENATGGETVELATQAGDQAGENGEGKPVKGDGEPAVQSKATRTAKKTEVEPVAGVAEAGVVEAEVVEAQLVKSVEVTTEPVTSIKLEREESTPPRYLPTQADMEAMIYRLKIDLEEVRRTAQDRELELQAQVERLRTEISTYQVTVRQLQNELKRSESLKTELDEAKQMILKLSQPPSSAAQPAAQPAAPPTALQSSQPSSVPQRSSSQPAPVPARASLPTPAAQKPAALSYLPSSRAAEPELESKPVAMTLPAMATPAKPVSADRNKPYQVALHRVLDHPTLPGSLPPMSSEPRPADKEEVKLSEADVGWMD